LGRTQIGKVRLTDSLINQGLSQHQRPPLRFSRGAYKVPIFLGLIGLIEA